MILCGRIVSAILRNYLRARGFPDIMQTPSPSSVRTSSQASPQASREQSAQSPFLWKSIRAYAGIGLISLGLVTFGAGMGAKIYQESRFPRPIKPVAADTSAQETYFQELATWREQNDKTDGYIRLGSLSMIGLYILGSSLVTDYSRMGRDKIEIDKIARNKKG